MRAAGEGGRALLLRAWRARVAGAAVTAEQAAAPGPRPLLAAHPPMPSTPIAAAATPQHLLPFPRAQQQWAAALSSSSAARQQHKEQPQGAKLPSLSELLKGSKQQQQQQQQQPPHRGGGGNSNSNGGRPNKHRAAEDQDRRSRLAAESRAAAQDTAERLAARLEMFESGRGKGGGSGGGGGNTNARRGGAAVGGGGGGKGATGRAHAHARPVAGKHFAQSDRKQRSAAAAEQRQKTRAAAAQQVAGRWASRLQELQQQQQQQEGEAGAGAASASAAPSSSPSSSSSSSSSSASPSAAAADEDARSSSPAPSPPAPQSSSQLREIILPAADAEPGALTARRLAALLGCGAARVERALADLGEPVRSEEDSVPLDAAELAALELGAALILPGGAGGGGGDGLSASPSSSSSASASSSSLLILEPRPPVVTVMGHVDHGKTSLLDALRRTDVAAGEAGGITQHIGAFSVELPGSSRRITFLDTPGHAAFGAMRARGAAVTDVVVLVVAADDGVMPQTAEALAHARAAGCPVVVAITKCDAAPAERPAQVKAQLAAELSLELEDFGGTVQVVETALPRGGGAGGDGVRGLVELEEALLLQAEVMELRAARRRRLKPGGEAVARVPAAGTVVEAHVERGMGPVATIVVQRGELRVGDVVVCGSAFGRVRALRGGGSTSAAAAAAADVAVGPGEHALVSGLRSLPSAGDELTVVSDEDRAARIARARLARAQDYARASLLRARHASAERRRAAALAEAARKKALSARLGELRDGKRHRARELGAALAELKAHMTGKGDAGRGSAAASASAGGSSKAAARGGAEAEDEEDDGEGEVGRAGGDDDDGEAATTDSPDAVAAAAADDDDDDDDAPHPDAPLIPFIIKADVQGSAEAVRDALLALPRRGTAHASVVLCAVGPCSLSDAHLAAATGARLVAFNVRPAAADVEAAIKSGGVRVMEHNVIYRLLDDARELLEREGAAAAAAAGGGAGGGGGGGGGALGGSGAVAGEREVVVGSGAVLQTFPLLRKGKSVGTVAGIGVSAGSLVRSDAAGSAAAAAAAAAALGGGGKGGGKSGSSSSSASLPPGAQVARLEYRLVRDGQVVASGLPCSDLRRQKLDVESVGQGAQCGAALDGGAWGGAAPRPGDVVECVAVVRGG
jgi:translation initiation factor IF-2